jgi:hypothetical protein
MITNKRQCLKALKAAGFQKSAMQMTRVATTYTLNGKWEGPVISVAEANVLVSDPRGPYGFIPALMSITNTREGAIKSYDALCAKLSEAGTLDMTMPPTVFDIVVAIARAYSAEQTVANVDLEVKDFEVGETVQVHAFGHWYAGKVVKLGRSNVHCEYTTGSGTTRVKAVAPGAVRHGGGR